MNFYKALLQTLSNINHTKIKIGIAIIATIFFYLKLRRKRNYFKDLPPSLPCTKDELGDEKDMSNIKRCTKPSDKLEMVFAKKGPSSIEPMTIPALWDLAVNKGGNEPFVGAEELQDDNNWKYKFKSWKETDAIINKIARSLVGIGINKFDICNIIGGCNPLYQYIFFGTIMAGAIPGGVYTTNLSGSLKYICNLCKTKLVFVENKLQLNKYLEVIDELKTVKYIVVYNNKVSLTTLRHKRIQMMDFTQFLAYGNQKHLQNEVSVRKQSTNPKQCAILIYTSGTTGGSKGCMLSHDNIYVGLHAWVDTTLKNGDKFPKEGRIISYLPLSHMAGQAESWYHPIFFRAKMNKKFTVYYCRKDFKKTLHLSLKACRPTAYLGVPRMYEKLYEAIQAGMASSFKTRLLFNFVMSVGKKYYHNTLAGGSGEIPLCWPFVSKICDNIIKSKMGFDKCEYFISGGGPLSNKIRETFASLNIRIMDIYGLSETGVIAQSVVNNFVPNACGPATLGSEIRIEHIDERDEENKGEICVRSRTVMMGYINEYDKTVKTFDKYGWLHTGDIGYLDKYNCLHITGRIKELLVTAGGENIAPVPVEDFIKKLCPALSQVIMIGDKKKYCCVIVSIACKVDSDGNATSILQSHAKSVNSNINTLEEAINDPIWHQYIRDAINEYNSNQSICVSNACRIQYFQILHEDLSIQNDTLAATFKVKRHKLYEVFNKEIDALYSDHPQIPVNAAKTL